MISDEFEMPIESSRVVDDNSDQHHRYHHQEVVSKDKFNGNGRVTLNARNMDSHIRQPH
jgi:hypothetical protein